MKTTITTNGTYFLRMSLGGDAHRVYLWAVSAIPCTEKARGGDWK